MVTHTKTWGETQKIGEVLGRELSVITRGGGSATIAISGDLGAGKTVFVQGVARGMGLKDRTVSPTFVLARVYHGKSGNLVHVDAYRIENVRGAKILTGGILRTLGTVTCIEWPEKIAWLVKSDITVSIEHERDGRKVTVAEVQKKAQRL